MKIRQIFLLACIVLLFIFFLNTPVNGLADKPALLEVEQLIKKAFEDHSWLFLESENDVRAYCESIYCEDIADKATKRIIDYKSSNSDWHSLVLVQDIDVVQSCFKEMQIKVRICYMDLSFNNGRLVYSVSGEGTFLVLLKEEKGKYKIAGTTPDISQGIWR